MPLSSVLPKQPSDHPAHGPPFLPHRNATERRRSLLTEANWASRPHRSAAGSAATHLLTEAKLWTRALNTAEAALKKLSGTEVLPEAATAPMTEAMIAAAHYESRTAEALQNP